MGHSFQSVVRPELFIRVMEVIAECLQANPQLLCYFSRVLTFAEEPQNALVKGSSVHGRTTFQLSNRPGQFGGR